MYPVDNDTAECQFAIPGIEEKILLELEVRVININEGRNEEIVRKCRELHGYSAFIAKMREYEQELGSLEAALKKAVEYCCRHDIIKEFLEKHAQEVTSMLMTEFNLDDAIAVAKEEGKEEAIEKLALNAFANGLPIDIICKITGLDMDTVKTLGSAQHINNDQ
jgi:hypothetical protein